MDEKARDSYSIRLSVDELPPLEAGDLREARDLVRSQLQWFLPMAACMGLGVLAGVPQPLIVREILAGIMPGVTFPHLWLFVAASAGLAVVGQAAGLARSYFRTRFRQGVSTAVRTRVVDHVLRLPPRFYDGEETGYLMSRVFGDTVQVEGIVSSHILTLVVDVAKFVGGVIILFFLHWKLTLVAAATLPLFALTVRTFRRRVAHISDRQMEANASFFKDLQEVLAGIHLVKAAGRESQSARRLMDGVRSIFAAEIPAVFASGGSAAIMALIAAGGGVLVLGYGATEVQAGRLTVPDLVAFNMYLAYLIGPSRSLSYFPIVVQPALTAWRRLKVILAMAPEQEGGEAPQSLSGEVAFEDVTFSYDRESPALANVTFHVAPGETVGVVGLSGAGKSTLAKLLCGFYAPEGGRVLLDSRPVTDYALSALRQRLGYLPQDAFFFSDTLRGNLAWSAPDADGAAMERALGDADLSTFLSKLEQGLDTPVGDRGFKLSGGERQRLAIARLLLERPDIAVLDESLSYLDRLTEERVREGLTRTLSGKTVLLIAHRRSTVEGLERVLVLENGRLAQDGNPRDLLKKPGAFRDLYG